MKTPKTILALMFVSAAAFGVAGVASANADVCVNTGGTLCAGYSLDPAKGAVCYGVVKDSFTGPYVVVCTGDNNCLTYYDLSGITKGCTTDGGAGNTVYSAMVFVDGLLP